MSDYEVNMIKPAKDNPKNTHGSKSAQAICYLVVAYRWGWLNAHSYFVGCYSDYDLATTCADGEAISRAGKYGVSVYLFAGHGGGEHVYHAPSSYQEELPSVNTRIELFETIGNKFVSMAEAGNIDKQNIKELAGHIEREKMMLEFIYGR